MSLSVALNLKTPEKIWVDFPINYQYLRIFYCPIYVNVKQGKLNTRALKGCL